MVGFQTRYEGFYGENATEEGHEEHNHIISNVGVPSVVVRGRDASLLPFSAPASAVRPPDRVLRL